MCRNRASVVVEVEKGAEKEHPRKDLEARGVSRCPSEKLEVQYGVNVDHDHTCTLNSVTFHQLHCHHPYASHRHLSLGPLQHPSP